MKKLFVFLLLFCNFLNSAEAEKKENTADSLPQAAYQKKGEELIKYVENYKMKVFKAF